jgi:glucose/arabinose dehydrogenase
MKFFAPRPALAVVSLAVVLACGNDNSTGPTPGPSPPAGSCAAGPPVTGTPNLTLTRVASGLNQPVDLQVPPGDRARLFVLEQAGRIRIVRGGAVVGTPFLDIMSRVGSGGERGLLGLAFHPQYPQNGRFFVNYTDRGGDTHISEFRASGNADVADAGSERELLFVEQPFANHNGGGLAFGPDGMLYVALGDGGSGGDPFGNGQSLRTPLGKVLRIDVDRGGPYAVPPDNPFANRADAFREIWAYGLRNPWRITFDRATGDLYIGDVGQNQVEEIDVGVASRRGGENYGWNITEGSQCFRPASGCNTAGLTPPVTEYRHNAGCSITGGYAYRGCRMPGYAGTYFYGDFCTGLVRSFRFQNGRATDERDWTNALGSGRLSVSSFGIDAEGEVYLVHYGGEIYRIDPAS